MTIQDGDELWFDDREHPLFNHKRMKEASEFIAHELFKFIDRHNIYGHLAKRMHECPAYINGLTNGETLVAQLRALGLVQSKIIDDLTSLWAGE